MLPKSGIEKLKLAAHDLVFWPEQATPAAGARRANDLSSEGLRYMSINDGEDAEAGDLFLGLGAFRGSAL